VDGEHAWAALHVNMQVAADLLDEFEDGDVATDGATADNERRRAGAPSMDAGSSMRQTKERGVGWVIFLESGHPLNGELTQTSLDASITLVRFHQTH
jgi:hypothetical protein